MTLYMAASTDEKLKALTVEAISTSTGSATSTKSQQLPSQFRTLARGDMIEK